MNRKVCREKSLLSVLLVVVFVFGLSLGAYTRQVLYHATGQQLHMNIEYRVLPIVKIEVTRGREVVARYRQVDPPTNNFAKLLEVVFHTHYDYSTSVTDLEGDERYLGKSNWNDHTFTCTSDTDPRIEVRLGNGTSPLFSRTTYTLQSEVVSVVVDEPSLSVNSTHSIVSLSATWSAPFNVNVTEIGLSMKFDRYDSTNDNYATILLFYTPLESVVSMLEGDTITVTYQFVFPEPFTAQMAKLFYILFLPYSDNVILVNATTGEEKSIGIDNYDAYDFFCTQDYGNLKVVAGNGVAPWDVWRYSLFSQVADSTTTISVTQGDQGTYVTITATLGFSADVNVTEIGLVLRGEIFDGVTDNYVEILLAYFALDQPIQMKAGQSLEVTIKLVFP